MRILVLSTAVPFPPTGGGKLRTWHLLRALAVRHELTLAGFTYGEEPADAPFPVRVAAVPWESPPLYRQMSGDDPSDAARAADHLDRRSDEPWCVSWAESDAMDAAIRRLTADRFDLVLLEGTPMARFLPALPDDAPRILDFLDVYTRMALQRASAQRGDEAERASFEAERTRRFERMAASRCDLCLAVSDDEAAAARGLLGIDHVAVVPNGVDTAYFTPSGAEPEYASLLFTGTMSYRPNSEAVVHFVREILPGVRRDVPEAVLHVVGNAPPDEVTALAGDGVVVHGFVPDLRPFYRRAAVVVVPLLRGGGTKLKVLEAAACGKAIVTTPVGAEGLPFRAGEDLIIAGPDAEFARAVVSLIGDRPRQGHLGQQARLASLSHDWQAVEDLVRTTVEAVPERRRSQGRARIVPA